ncbi:ExbD/TolR family protein [Rhodobium gokarnense]|uniref:Biopolymer transport protein ExbD n=1 Tax=Rhodobium gokarnense TaxID=364296 RepID=A0ABT3HBC3_9HYPH|nr:biopolymer transporter ExbD [Rhodobium gokarnense]MCW2307687.1 biopolymer transport protein ExbD [Rhodobium gokarnense]
MKLERARRRRPIGITSLIDVIFLLLLFFMLASSFSRYQALPVSAGISGAGNSSSRPLLLRVHDATRIDLNGEAVTLEELAERLGETGGAGSNAGAKPVAIWSGPEAATQHVVDALVAVRGAGREALVIAGQGR